MKINRRHFISTSALTAGNIATFKLRAFNKALTGLGLGELYKNDFKIGTAISRHTFHRNDTELLKLIKNEFNAVTPENEMKWSHVHPAENEWQFETTDRFVEFGLANNMHIVGHVLVWHSQLPRTVFQDEKGDRVDKTTLMKRMENHIVQLVGRYKGKIDTWDVVNEAITPDGWRKTPWYEIAGPEFMERAFQVAHETDPGCQLLYNDYSMDNPRRRELVVEIMKDYLKRGVPVNGIGMQGHVSLNDPDLDEFEKSIEAFASTGLRVHITELDVDVLPFDWSRSAEISNRAEYRKEMNPYTEGLPPEIDEKLTKRYEDLFKLFLKHRDKIDRVTFWGTTDGESWKNNFPMRGRTNYPLLFDRKRKPKNAYFAVAALKK
ncbi:MAG: endo-1,4-beta-xylanase [Tangfeifania sp.]